MSKQPPNSEFTTHKKAVNLHSVVNANDGSQPLLLNLLSPQRERIASCLWCVPSNIRQLTSTLGSKSRMDTGQTTMKNGHHYKTQHAHNLIRTSYPPILNLRAQLVRFKMYLTGNNAIQTFRKWTTNVLNASCVNCLHSWEVVTLPNSKINIIFQKLH